MYSYIKPIILLLLFLAVLPILAQDPMDNPATDITPAPIVIEITSEPPLSTSEAVSTESPSPQAPAVLTIDPVTTVTGEPSPIASQEPEVTPLVSPTPSTLPFIFRTSFSDGLPSEFGIGTEWVLIDVEGGKAIQNSAAADLFYQPATLREAEIELKTQINTGALTLFVRQSSEGAYRLTVSNSLMTLYKGSESLGTALVTLTSDTWVTLKLNAIAEHITASLNGSVMITASDENSLPAGWVGFGVEGDSVVRVDDISIAGSDPVAVIVPPTPIVPIESPTRESALENRVPPAAAAFVPDITSLQRVSISSTGEQTNDQSAFAELSADARYIAFVSHASNLVPDDTNAKEDVFVRDLQTGLTNRVSVSSQGEQSNNTSWGVDISDDGRYVAFGSWASNLVSDDTNGVSDVFVHDRQTGTTTRVSVSSSGQEGNAISEYPFLSADGRYIAFRSNASNLVTGDTGVSDLFIYDQQTGEITRILIDSTSPDGNGIHDDFAMSANARYIVFSSNTFTFGSEGVNYHPDVFVHDRETGQTKSLSVSPNGKEGNEGSYYPSISADGRYITFSAHASNLVWGDTGSFMDVFLYDQQTSQLTRISTNFVNQEGNNTSYYPSISADGRYIAYSSNASNLVMGDTNLDNDVFVYDRQTKQTILISRNSNGSQASSNATAYLSISADGQYVGFDSSAANLASDDTNGVPDIFVAPVIFPALPVPPSNLAASVTGTSIQLTWTENAVDETSYKIQPLKGIGVFATLAANSNSYTYSSASCGRQYGFQIVAWRSSDNASSSETILVDMPACPPLSTSIERASVGYGSTQGQGELGIVSKNGRFVAFESSESTLVANDTNNKRDIFVRDRATGQTKRVSLNNSGGQANGDSMNPVVSADGRFITFASAATNLVNGDTNGQTDVFVYDLYTRQITRVNISSNGQQADQTSGAARISGDGRYVAFMSTSNLLVSNDTNTGTNDIFVHDLVTRVTIRVNLNADGNETSGTFYIGSISGDGRYVTFYSEATLTPGDFNLSGDTFIRDLFAETTTLVSVTGAGQAANSESRPSSISPDGRYVAFQSAADNLVANDTNNTWDIFIRDRQTNQTFLVSKSSAGQQGNADSYGADISDDGRYIVFQSMATNLVADDTYRGCWNFQTQQNDANCYDIFVHDRQTGQTVMVSRSAGGEQAQGTSDWVSISGDGQFVSFMSEADNLVAGDTNNTWDIFVGPVAVSAPPAPTTIERASVAYGGGGNGGELGFISNDGRFVAFESYEAIVSHDTNSKRDIYLRDRLTQQTTLVSVSSTAQQGNNDSINPVVSADGRFVAFSSDASNLVVDDTNERSDIFVHDLLTGETTRVNVSSSGQQADQGSYNARISGDGRFVAFMSYSNVLVSGDTGGANADIFVHDRQTGQTIRVNIGPNGEQTSGETYIGALSGDGRFITFFAGSNSLVTNDTNNTGDAFVRDLVAGQTTQVVGSNGQQGDAESRPFSLSSDGRYVGLMSAASNFADGDTNNTWDVFLYDRQTSQLSLVSKTSSGVLGNSSSYGGFVSDDGRYMAFQSMATNLVADDTYRGCWNFQTQQNAANCYDIFVHDRQTGQTVMVSRNAGGEQAQGTSDWVSISGDGHLVAFMSEASNLVAYDTNNTWDMFVAPVGTSSMPVLTAPTNLSATLQGTAILLAWSDNASDETGFIVERTEDSTTWSLITTTSTSVNTYTDASVLCGRSYSYRVKAVRSVNNTASNYSNTATRLSTTCAALSAPVLSQPVNNAQTNIAQPDFTWTPVSGADHYEMQLSANVTFSNAITIVNLMEPHYTPSTPLANGAYYWRVRAYNQALPPVAGIWSASRRVSIDTIPLAAVTSLVLPASNASITITRPSFSWGLVTGAAKYHIQISSTETFDVFVTDVVVTTLSYSLPISGPALSQGRYFWRVSTLDSANNEGTFSPTRQFEVFIGTAPLQGSFVPIGKPKFTWASLGAGVLYNILIDDNGDFSDAAILNPSPLAGLTYTPTIALSEGLTYWRVVGITETPANDGIPHTFIVAPIPVAPVLVSPTNASGTNDNTPSLDWQPISTVASLSVSYEVQIAQNNVFTAGMQSYPQVETPFELTTPLTDGVKYWRVRALYLTSGNAISGPWSLVRSFTVDTTPPASPNLNAPAMDAVTSSLRPSFSWLATLGATRYHLQVSPTEDFTQLTLDKTVTTLNYAIPAAEPGLAQGDYYWRVSAIDIGSNESAFSESRYLTVFLGLKPNDGLFTMVRRPTFTWASAGVGVQYTLQIDISPEFITPLVSTNPLTTTSYTLPAALPELADGMYVWRVLRVGEVPVSPVYRTLFVGTPPTPPVLIAPLNNPILNRIEAERIGFAWNPVSVPEGAVLEYELQIARNIAFNPIVTTFMTPTPSAVLALDNVDGPYYWRVRARFSGVAGSFSTAGTFRLDQTAVASPQLNVPVDNSVISNIYPVLTWASVPAASFYRVELSTDEMFTDLIINQIINPTSYALPDDLDVGTYYWRITAMDAARNESTVSTGRSFGLAIPPQAQAGPDQTLSDIDQTGSELVTLDGSGSNDDSELMTYEWREAGLVIGTGETPQVDLSVGLHLITLTVIDDMGLMSTDTVIITITDTP